MERLGRMDQLMVTHNYKLGDFGDALQARAAPGFTLFRSYSLTPFLFHDL